MQDDLIRRKDLNLSFNREDTVVVNNRLYVRADVILEKLNAIPTVDAVEVVQYRKKLQALKFAYQIVTDKRNRERYCLSFLQSKSTGQCMYYGEMLDTLNEIAKELKKEEHNDETR